MQIKFIDILSQIIAWRKEEVLDELQAFIAKCRGLEGFYLDFRRESTNTP